MHRPVKSFLIHPLVKKFLPHCGQRQRDFQMLAGTQNIIHTGKIIEARSLLWFIQPVV